MTVTQHYAYVDYGAIGDPGVIIQEVMVDGSHVEPTGKDTWINGESFRSAGTPTHETLRAWDELLKANGWRRASDWSNAGDQFTTIVERI